ncbi:MAG TPA: PASTA domain-containing protein [Ktedonobacterales bacterium]|nr:PASTA domain-containing protein [Ktedonobacterales bacterium]
MQRTATQQGSVIQRGLSFRGLQPGEATVLVERSHWLPLAMQAWPALLAGMVLVGLLAGQLLTRTAPQAWSLGEMVAAILALALLARWSILDAYPWWYRLYVVTNQRVIRSDGGIRQMMEEVDLRKVLAANVEIRSPGEWLLGYGRVVITTANDFAMTFDDIAAPKSVATLILQARDTHAPPRHKSGPVVADPTLKHVLDSLAQTEAPPQPTPLDAACSHHWPLSRAVNAPIATGEPVLGVVSRHWWALVSRARMALAIFSIALFLIPSGFWLHLLVILPIALAVMCVAAIWFLIIYLDFADDVFIFTTQRIIDVERRYFVLYETDLSIEYTNIQDVRRTDPSAWARMLRFGTVAVDGPNDIKLVMDHVPQPKLIEAAIKHNTDTLRKGKEARAANREKLEMKDWFTAVIGEMIVTAPDLSGLTMEEAIERAQQMGLRPTLAGESFVVPGTPAGLVISQVPSPGARMLRGGDIALILSRLW